jgi:hypothetical protein
LFAAARRQTLALQEFELVVPPPAVLAALDVLMGSGWRAPGYLPEKDRMVRRVSNVRLADEAGRNTVLRWRIFSIPPDVRDETRCLPGIEAVKWMSTAFTAAAPHIRLLEILSTERDEPLPMWIWEAKELLRQPIDWNGFRDALAWCPRNELVQARIEELANHWDLRIPKIAMPQECAPDPHSLGGKLRLMAHDYHVWCEQAAGPSSRPRPLHYLRLRWAARGLPQMAALSLRMLWQHWTKARADR